MGKGEIVFPSVPIFDTISLFAAELEDPRIGRWGKGLTPALVFVAFVEDKATMSFPRFDKILVIQPNAEVNGDGNERQLC